MNEKRLAYVVRNFLGGGSRQAQNTFDIHLFRKASYLQILWSKACAPLQRLHVSAYDHVSIRDTYLRYTMRLVYR